MGTRSCASSSLRWARTSAAARTAGRNTRRCALTGTGELVPVELHGSAHLTALLAADGFMVVPPGTATLAAHGKVRFLPLRGLHG
jgi:molybdopterin biosynthesis enzyme